MSDPDFSGAVESALEDSKQDGPGDRQEALSVLTDEFENLSADEIESLLENAEEGADGDSDVTAAAAFQKLRLANRSRGIAKKAAERFREQAGVSVAGTEKAEPGEPEDAGMSEKAWVPYQGPRGGSGWKNTDTGDVHYGDEPPGGTPEGIPDSMDELQDAVASGELSVEDIEAAGGESDYGETDREGLSDQDRSDLGLAEQPDDAVESGELDEMRSEDVPNPLEGGGDDGSPKNPDALPENLGDTNAMELEGALGDAYYEPDETGQMDADEVADAWDRMGAAGDPPDWLADGAYPGDLAMEMTRGSGAGEPSTDQVNDAAAVVVDEAMGMDNVTYDLVSEVVSSDRFNHVDADRSQLVDEVAEQLGVGRGEKLHPAAEKARKVFRGVLEEKEWVPYRGPQGGEGWKDTDSGDVVYGGEPPGESMSREDMREEIQDELSTMPRDDLEQALMDLGHGEPPDASLSDEELASEVAGSLTQDQMFEAVEGQEEVDPDDTDSAEEPEPEPDDEDWSPPGTMDDHSLLSAMEIAGVDDSSDLEDDQAVEEMMDAYRQTSADEDTNREDLERAAEELAKQAADMGPWALKAKMSYAARSSAKT